MIIDDDPQLRQLLGDRLEACGFQAITAFDGRQGVKLMQEENPDLVLLDLGMPAMGGMATLAEIRKLNPAIPVIILTSHGTARKALEAKQCGAGGFLMKSSEPFFCWRQSRRHCQAKHTLDQILEKNFIK
ncbi:MAG: response regulator [bacterium]